MGAGAALFMEALKSAAGGAGVGGVQKAEPDIIKQCYELFERRMDEMLKKKPKGHRSRKPTIKDGLDRVARQHWTKKHAEDLIGLLDSIGTTLELHADFAKKQSALLVEFTLIVTKSLKVIVDSLHSAQVSTDDDD